MCVGISNWIPRKEALIILIFFKKLKQNHSNIGMLPKILPQIHKGVAVTLQYLPNQTKLSIAHTCTHYACITQLVLTLSFMEAVKGCTKPVTLRVQDMCSRCSGTGAEPGKKPQTCPYCQGRGEVSADERGGCGSDYF